MDVLVTGATGCLGRNLVARLAADGNFQVTATGRNLTIGRNIQRKNVEFIAAEITDKEKIFHLTRGKAAVFHCAALASPWGKYEDFFRSNIIGTENVVSASLASGVSRFVHVSTPSIYYDGTSREQILETDALPNRPVNHYAKTKRAAEEIVDNGFQLGLPTVTIRPRAIFGPHDTAILPRLIRMAKRGWFPLISNGDARVDVTCVSNVVDAMILALSDDSRILGSKYNITNDEPMSVRELMTSVFDALGLSVQFRKVPFHAAYSVAAGMEWLHQFPPFSKKEPILTRYSIGLLGLSQTLNISAAKRELRYTARKSVKDGLGEFAHWMTTRDAHASSI